MHTLVIEGVKWGEDRRNSLLGKSSSRLGERPYLKKIRQDTIERTSNVFCADTRSHTCKQHTCTYIPPAPHITCGSVSVGPISEFLVLVWMGRCWGPTFLVNSSYQRWTNPRTTENHWARGCLWPFSKPGLHQVQCVVVKSQDWMMSIKHTCQDGCQCYNFRILDSESPISSQLWWCIPVIQALRR